MKSLMKIIKELKNRFLSTEIGPKTIFSYVKFKLLIEYF